MDHGLIDEAARQLRQAARDGTGCAPVREILGTADDLDVAYQVQRQNVDWAISHGRQVSGGKIGLTAEAVQQQLGVDQPDSGTHG